MGWISHAVLCEYTEGFGNLAVHALRALINLLFQKHQQCLQVLKLASFALNARLSSLCLSAG